ncbi:hypothetical protein [Magnetospirillum sp. LM-5]|uniref:hypothetical protein n=1 Tax=Magnetospirillum sp. LM-5 TaxID=2681466 RepID=UPI0020C25354|nr:hypothetical protein [Magnetospirillum sp. LM-5]
MSTGLPNKIGEKYTGAKPRDFFTGDYIVASLAWMWGIEGARPDRWDALGAAISMVIVWGQRGGA